MEVMDEAIESLGGDRELLAPQSKDAGSLSSEVSGKKGEFLEKSDDILDRREKWKMEAEALRKNETLTPAERARQAVLMERLTLASHYERFQKIAWEIDELDEKIAKLRAEQRGDAVRLRTVNEYPEVDAKVIKEKEKEVEKVQKERDDLFKKAEDHPDEVESEELEVAEKRLRLAKRELEALPTFEAKRATYRASLIARMDERDKTIKKEEEAAKELGKTLEKVMADLTLLEFRAGDLEDPPAPETGPANEGSFTYRLEKNLRETADTVAEGTVKAAKVGGRGGYIAGVGALAVVAGLATIPLRFASVQIKRLYNFAMDPMSAMKGFDRIGKFYKEHGAWNGTGEAIQWILMGDPEPEKKDKKK
jgi:hypothetical protein